MAITQITHTFKLIMNKIESFFTEYKNTSHIAVVAVTVLSFFFVANNYINSQIKSQITDETYINNLSKRLRPLSIFNIEGIPTYDHGGGRYIKKLIPKLDKDGYLKTVTIITRSFLQNAPILIHVGYKNYSYSKERTGTCKWQYNFSNRGKFKLHSKPTEEIKEYDPFFLVEVLP